MARTMKSPLMMLRKRPATALHPLHVFLLERRITLTEFAALVGWSPRKLYDVVMWRHYPRDSNLGDIAADLGFESFDLFPFHDPSGQIINTKHAASSKKKEKKR